MAEIVPSAIERLSADLRKRLSIVQQARAEDADAVRSAYARLGVDAEIAPFFPTCQRAWRRHSWLFPVPAPRPSPELSAIGRPSVLVPLPHALDQDQFVNAGVLEESGGAIRIEQRDFTPERLATEITALLSDPARLARMAEAAKERAPPTAADRLADLVLKVARN